MANSIETKVAVLEQDLRQMGGLFDRLDISIEKITELNISIKEVLAVHEQRITATEVDIERTYDTFEGVKYYTLQSASSVKVACLPRRCQRLGHRVSHTLPWLLRYHLPHPSCLSMCFGGHRCACLGKATVR